MNAIVDNFPPSITFLNMTGDISITWTPENRERILELIRKYMAQGYTFFTVKKVPILKINKKQRVGKKMLDDIDNLVIPDKEFEKMMAAVDDREVSELLAGGQASLGKRAADRRAIDTVKRAEKPEDVIDEQSVAMRPVRGG